ncbi:MAG: dihydrofolate reductase [Bacteroidaceae bacterium]|nr:dihydrofolate reductase [Bacteroidaceae bacterium]
MIHIIAAVARNGAIGLDNKLLYHMPADMRHFKELTTGHTVVMGRNTFESLPKGALPNRRNIVLTRNATYSAPNIEVFPSLKDALQACRTDAEVYIIGGASVYAEAMSCADELNLTWIDDTPPQADTFFPDIDYNVWQENRLEEHQPDDRHLHPYSFVDYVRKTALQALIVVAIGVSAMLGACNAENNLRKGDQFYARGEYYDAAAEYRAAYSKTPMKYRDRRGERALKMADCYRRINYTAKAIGAYQNGIRYIEKARSDRHKLAELELRRYQTDDEKSLSSRQARQVLATEEELQRLDSLAEVQLLEATLHLARLQMKSGDYKNAQISFQNYINMVQECGASHALICTPQNDTLARNGLLGAQQAPIWKERASLYSVKREPIFNSRRSDFSPMLFGDNYEQLYLTSTRPQATGDDVSGITGTKYSDIFMSQKDEKGRWQSPEQIEGELNSELDDGVCSFSPDGRTMYLTRCTADPDYPRYAQIFSSTRSDASWGKPQEVRISRDSLSCFAHPAVSPDGEWLYFVSDMAGGHGGKDIWRIHMDGAVLGGVENLGAPINTPGDEMFPAFRPNGDFYFSSDGHPGMGGLDLFIAKQDSITHQWTVKNLGYPMNSAGDDFGMTFEGPYNRGFFSSNRGDARGWDHIWSFDCPEVVQTVRGWVYEKDGYELPEALVYMVGTDGTNQKLSVRGDGSFTAVVQPYVNYIFLGTCKGYLNHTNSLNVDTSHVSKEYVLQFPLASISAPVLIRNVFYEFDSAELTESSTSALDSLVTMLNENPNITIELASHCDSRGSEEYNLRLSGRRAQSVVNYLIAHGIASDRLTPRGYGKSRPKVVRRRQAEQYPFLNEGDTLTADFITALEDDAQREVANSLNRRTEFKVLRTTYGQ